MSKRSRYRILSICIKSHKGVWITTGRLYYSSSKEKRRLSMCSIRKRNSKAISRDISYSNYVFIP